MCLICVDFQRGVLKVSEAKRALFEMRAALDPEHIQEVEDVIAAGEANEGATTTPVNVASRVPLTAQSGGGTAVPSLSPSPSKTTP